METKQVKTIRIFLASSNELKADRDQFAAFITRLNKHYKPRGFEFVLDVWEFTDPAYNNKRKQDEYNALIRQSDYFVALFYTKAGKYTVEELMVARKECESRQMPLLIYFRDLSFWQVLWRKDKNLEEIKQYIGDDMKHFWGRYNNNDKLHLDFVLWLDSKLNQNSSIRVEGDDVKIGDLSVAQFSQLPFALNNTEYQRLYEQLTEMDQDIELLRQNAAEYPENKKFSERLSQKVLAREKLLEEVQRLQEALLGAAKRIAELRKQQASEKLAKAVDAFENGQLEMANTYLDELKQEGGQLYKEILSRQDELKIKNEQMKSHIDALGLQAQTVMADTSTPIEERISQIRIIYAEADKWAAACNYPVEKYAKLLFDYAGFLYKYAYYPESVEVYLRQITLAEKLYGSNHLTTATSYNNIGMVYHTQGNEIQALEYYTKALDIQENVLGTNHPGTASSYNNIGAIYDYLCKYDRALEYYTKALEILKSVLGEDHLGIAYSCNNIGGVYFSQYKYALALAYHKKALEIFKKALGEEHPSTAASYNNIGGVFMAQGKYNQALEHHKKALEIDEKVLGGNHPCTVIDYNNIGSVCKAMGEYDQALKYYTKVLNIKTEVLGEDRLGTVQSFYYIGSVYFDMGEYNESLKCYEKALVIQKKALGEDHLDTVQSFYYIGSVYFDMSEYDEALKCYQKALAIQKIKLGEDHPDAVSSYNIIGKIYDVKDDSGHALKYYSKALCICEKVLGEYHLDTADSYNNIAWIHYKRSRYKRALIFLEKAYAIYKQKLGEDHPYTKDTKRNIEFVQIMQGDQ